MSSWSINHTSLVVDFSHARQIGSSPQVSVGENKHDLKPPPSIGSMTNVRYILGFA